MSATANTGTTLDTSTVYTDSGAMSWSPNGSTVSGQSSETDTNSATIGSQISSGGVINLTESDGGAEHVTFSSSSSDYADSSGSVTYTDNWNV